MNIVDRQRDHDNNIISLLDLLDKLEDQLEKIIQEPLKMFCHVKARDTMEISMEIRDVVNNEATAELEYRRGERE
jgi:hypothetical protein